MDHHSSGGTSNSRFFGATGNGPGSTSATHRSYYQPSDNGSNSDYGDVTPDEDAMARTRVQLVSSRRKPSEEPDDLELDSYRSSFASTTTTTTTSSTSSSKKAAATTASSYLEVTTPEYKHPSGSRSKTKATLRKSMAKALAFGSSADTPDSDLSPNPNRQSLPTLEATRPSDATNKTTTTHRDHPTARRGSVESSHSFATHARSGDNHNTDTNHMYYVPGSPVVSSTKSSSAIERSRAKSSRSEPKTAVVTEVGGGVDAFALPLFTNKDRNTTNGCSSKHTQHLERVVEPPHVTMEETQKYTFALVLKHTEQVYQLLRHRFPSRSATSIRRDLPYQVSQLQQKCVRRLIQAGLGISILENDVYDTSAEDQDEEQACKNICVLVDPKKDKDLLLHEFKREMDELSIRQGASIARLGEESLDSLKEMCFSPALELQLTHNIIQNALRDYDKEEWVIDVNKELTVSDVVLECFPLHDRAFNKKFFAEYRKRTFEMNPRKAATGNIDRWAVEELRLHFGERVAFLFAFMHIYTKHLLPLMIVGLAYYLAFRFADGEVWRQYLQGLAILGFGVACFWGPSFLVCWERETRILVEKWNLSKYKNTVYERNDSNPNFQYLWVKNELTREMEKVPKQRKNHWIQLTMLFYVLLSAIIQCICLMPFIQWYVYAKNAPQCYECHLKETSSSSLYACTWYITCFNSADSTLGTDRWSYILIQGIALGLLIDIIFFEVFNWVSEKFVRWENYAKKSDYENRLIHRRFVFVWSNWFFWFLFLAFVYLPFGGLFIERMRQLNLQWLVPYDWDASLLTLDTLFVTPLVVTQFLNMILETFVPYLLRKLRGRPVVCRKSSPFRWCGRRVRRMFRTVDLDLSGPDGSSSKNLTAQRLATLVKQKTQFAVPVLLSSDDCNQYTAYEIIAELKLPVFDPMLDYLDACIQFSYVVMFSVVWPLLPLPAFVNNLLEVRGDAFRLLFGHRRPMPRRDTSIGEWVTVLSYANIIGVTVVMGFIVAYHWGYFMVPCNYKFSAGYMVPFSTLDKCKGEVEQFNDARWKMLQIVVFVVLEHVGFCLRYLVHQVEKTPASIRNSGYQRLKQIQELTSSRAAHATQFIYVQKLRELFDKFDVERDGHLAENELIPFLAEWICKHPSELLPCSSIIFRYMDKNGLGKVPFATCCLMLQHVHHDRFFSCLLGIYDPLNGDLNDQIWRAGDAIEFRRVMSAVSSVVSERRSSLASLPSMSHASVADSFIRPRDSTFFYVEPEKHDV